MDDRRQALLDGMGIVVWRQRQAAVDPPAVLDVEPAAPPAVADPVSPAPAVRPAPPAEGLDWAGLRDAVAACQQCALAGSRTQTVFGRGSETARLLVLGEAPGAEEDARGLPFVGRAGQLLDRMLAALGLDEEQFYIANVLKCRPPGNRNPTADEAHTCAPWLERQIDLLSPELIVAVGKVAAQRLLGEDAPLYKLRGRVHRYGPRSIPVIVTYHPSYLLRTPSDKGKAWRDLLFAVSSAGDGALEHRA